MSVTRKRILCIEDDLGTYELISVLLKDAKVISAQSTAEALRRASKTKFDLYLLDHNLPDGTGFEVCCYIRTFDHHTPILFCTASENITEAQVRVMGAQGLIKKGPNFLDDLIAAVSRLLPASADPLLPPIPPRPALGGARPIIHS